MSFEELTRILRDVLPLRYSGKVRDLYELPGGYLLSVASDRRSIFDFRLGFDVEGEGEILHAFNVAARLVLDERLQLIGFRHDCAAIGPAMDLYVPDALRGLGELQKRAMVVYELEMIPVESVMRALLTGGGYRSYVKNGMLCGHPLPRDLRDGDRIPQGNIWTPTTKARIGHDEDLPYAEQWRKYPELAHSSHEIFAAFGTYAEDHGIIVADAKMEAGRPLTVADAPTEKLHASIEDLYWGDELFTPDCARFVDKDEYETFFVKAGQPLSMTRDKEILRAWGRQYGLHDSARFDPLSKKDRERVRALPAPREIIRHYREAQKDLFIQLYGMSIEDFQREKLGIRPPIIH